MGFEAGGGGRSEKRNKRENEHNPEAKRTSIGSLFHKQQLSPGSDKIGKKRFKAIKETLP